MTFTEEISAEKEKIIDLIKPIEALITKHKTTDRMINVNKLEKLGTKSDLADWIFRLEQKLLSTTVLLEKCSHEIKSLDEKADVGKDLNDKMDKVIALHSKENLNENKNLMTKLEETTLGNREQIAELTTIIKNNEKRQNKITDWTKIDFKTPMKSVIKEVASENERHRSVILFGVDDETKIEDVFEELGIKPHCEKIVRFRKKDSVNPTPVKVTFSSVSTVSEVLKLKTHLKNCGIEKYKKIYISKELSKDEIIKRNNLVKEMKQKISKNPDTHWFIRNGEVHSKEHYLASINDPSDGDHSDDEFKFKVKF